MWADFLSHFQEDPDGDRDEGEVGGGGADETTEDKMPRFSRMGPADLGIV